MPDDWLDRMDRWSAHAQRPDTQATRPDRNPAIFDAVRDSLAALTPDERARLAACVASDPRWQVARSAAEATATRLGRRDDIVVARNATARFDGDLVPVAEGFLTLAALLDVLPAETATSLVAPWRQALGPTVHLEALRLHQIREFGLAKTLSDVSLHRCTLEHVSIGNRGFTRPDERTTIRHLTADQCAFSWVSCDPAVVLDDVAIKRPTRWSEVWVQGAVLRHVVLDGRFGALTIRSSRAAADAAERAAVMEANADFYRGVDWALDIRTARFSAGCELEGVPGHLILRDPASTVLVTADMARSGRWRSLDLGAYGFALAKLATGSVSSQVLVAAIAGPKRDADLAMLDILRRARLAEPD